MFQLIPTSEQNIQTSKYKHLEIWSKDYALTWKQKLAVHRDVTMKLTNYMKELSTFKNSGIKIGLMNGISKYFELLPKAKPRKMHHSEV